MQPTAEPRDPDGTTTTSSRSRHDQDAHLAPYLDELASTPLGDPRRAILRDRLVAGHPPVVCAQLTEDM